jgi:hypothetical protein
MSKNPGRRQFSKHEDTKAQRVFVSSCLSAFVMMPSDRDTKE